MKYVLAALTGGIAGLIAGVVLGIPLMLWGPGSNDPLAVLWIFFGGLLTAPAGAAVGLAITWGTPRGRFAAGTRVGPAVLGAFVAMASALVFLRAEVLDEWFNLPVFGAMGAGAGLLTSKLLRSNAARSPRRTGRPRA